MPGEKRSEGSSSASTPVVNLLSSQQSDLQARAERHQMTDRDACAVKQPKRCDPMTQQILKNPVVLERTGLSGPTRDRLEAKGEFPKRLSISSRRVGWLAEDIDAWIEARRVASTTK